MHGKGRSTQRWDPGLLDTATGILGGDAQVLDKISLTWNGPSFLDEAGKSLGRASRPGWLSQHPSAVRWGCSELTDSGCRGRVPQWGALGWEQWQQGPAGASFRWVSWDFKEDRRVSIPSSVGTDNTSEALENLHQVGVFTQVDLAEQQLQKWQIKGLLQFGEDVVHYSGYRDQVATGFQRFPVHTLGDEGFVAEAFEEGKWLVYGIGDLQLLVHEVLEKSLFQGSCHSEHPGC